MVAGVKVTTRLFAALVSPIVWFVVVIETDVAGSVYGWMLIAGNCNYLWFTEQAKSENDLMLIV